MAATNKISIVIELRGAGAGAGGNAVGTVFTALAWANTHVISLNFMYEAE